MLHALSALVGDHLEEIDLLLQYLRLGVDHADDADLWGGGGEGGEGRGEGGMDGGREGAVFSLCSFSECVPLYVLPVIVSEKLINVPRLLRMDI